MESKEPHQTDEALDLTALRPESDPDLTSRVVRNVLNAVGAEYKEPISLGTRLLFALGSPRMAVMAAVLLASIVGASLLGSPSETGPPPRAVVLAAGMTPPFIELIVSGQTPTATDVIVHFGEHE